MYLIYPQSTSFCSCSQVRVIDTLWNITNRMVIIVTQFVGGDLTTAAAKSSIGASKRAHHTHFSWPLESTMVIISRVEPTRSKLRTTLYNVAPFELVLGKNGHVLYVNLSHFTFVQLHAPWGRKVARKA